MAQEAYCSYEVAKLLKGKGFDWDCTSHFDSNHIECPNTPMNFNSTKYWVSRPTHQMTCAWLREKGYHIYTFMLKDNIWVYEIQKLDEDWTFSLRGFSSHDDAVKEGVKYTLENLI